MRRFHEQDRLAVHAARWAFKKYHALFQEYLYDAAMRPRPTNRVPMLKPS